MTRSPLYPFKFEPFFRPMPWGGERLRSWVTQASIPSDRIGEVWLLSDHPIHRSKVVNGPLSGATIGELLTDFGEKLLGFPAARFPLLIKFLDAAENLSIQVHPDDLSALRWAPQEGGKSEAWYVLESNEQSRIYLGLVDGLDREKVAEAAGTRMLPECMWNFVPIPGQCFNVPAGCIHALGGGTVVLEVQQTSDATFRLFDWDRVGHDAKPRPLHLEPGLACLQHPLPTAGLQIPVTDANGVEKLVDTPFFRMQRLQKPGQIEGGTLLVNLFNQCQLETEMESFTVRRGELWLCPADLGSCRISGQVEELIAIEVKEPSL